MMCANNWQPLSSDREWRAYTCLCTRAYVRACTCACVCFHAAVFWNSCLARGENWMWSGNTCGNTSGNTEIQKTHPWLSPLLSQKEVLCRFLMAELNGINLECPFWKGIFIPGEFQLKSLRREGRVFQREPKSCTWFRVGFCLFSHNQKTWWEAFQFQHNWSWWHLQHMDLPQKWKPGTNGTKVRAWNWPF